MSMTIVKKMIGRATKTPAIKNGTKLPSESTLMASNGTHPIGLVLRIMNEIVIVAVRAAVRQVKLSF